MQQTHKYNELVTHSAASGVATFYKFNCNGMYDPNNSVTGHQPYYFDQLTAVYNTYTVLKSSITISSQPAITSTGPWLQTVYLDDDANGVANAVVAAEREGCDWTFQHASNAPFRELKCYFNAAKMFGGDPLSDTDLQGSASANPTEQAVFHFQMYTPSLENATVNVFVSMTFDCQFDEFVTAAPS